MEELKKVDLKVLKEAIKEFNDSGIWQGILDKKVSAIGPFDTLKETFMRAVELIPEEKEDELPDLVVDVYNALAMMEEGAEESEAEEEQKTVVMEDVEPNNEDEPTEQEEPVEEDLPPIRYIEVDRFVTREPFEGLFPIKDEVLKAIKRDMEAGGYDESQLIIAWEKSDGEFIVLDGHTRLKVAKELGITEVPTAVYDFDSEDEALEYVIHLQKDRRNLTDAEILACVEAVDRRRPRGGDQKSGRKKSAQPIENISKNENIKFNNLKPSHVKTAEKLGISPSKVQQARKVLDKADEATKQAVKQGKKTIHEAYKEIKQKEQKQKQRSQESVDMKTEVERLFKPDGLQDLKGLLLKRLEGTEDKVKAVRAFHKAVKLADRRLEKLVEKVA